MSRSGSRRTRRALTVHVTDGRGRGVPGGRALAAWLSGAAPRRARGVVCIALISDAAMRALNRTYRGVDRATDVLSFPDEPESPGRRPRSGRVSGIAIGRPLRRQPAQARAHGPDVSLGDLAIATGLARRQAGFFGHSLATELRILALHGLLHLLGYDHEADQGEMGRLEDRLRRRAGLPSSLIARVTPVAGPR